MRRIVIVMLAFVAAMFVGLTAYSALRDNVAMATNDCASLRTMLNEETAAQKAAINPLGKYDSEVRVADLQNALKALCNKTEESASPTTSAPIPTATATATTTVTVTVTATPTADPRYACRPTFYNDEPGSLGSYTFGRPVTKTDLNRVVQELRDRVWCDPALLVQKAREYKVLSLDAAQGHELAIKLAAQAKSGQQSEWDALYEQFIVRLAASQNSLGVLPAGTYTSYVMLRGSSSDVPYVATVKVWRSGGDATLVSILPDGTRLEQRTVCGYQLQTMIVVTWAVVPKLRDIPRNTEGTPVKPTPTPTPTTTTPTTSTPTPTPTTSTAMPSKASATPAKTDASPTPGDSIPATPDPTPTPKATPLVPNK